jgi:hypothetical protein
MTDIEQRIADETAAKMRIHNLKQAHRRLADIRRDLRGLDMLLSPDGDETEFSKAARHIADNQVENLMWKIEQAVRDGQKETK